MKVSVLMAVNKDDGFLNEAIQSIISQSYSNFEFDRKSKGINNNGEKVYEFYYSNSDIKQERKIAQDFDDWTPENRNKRRLELTSWIIANWGIDRHFQALYDEGANHGHPHKNTSDWRLLFYEGIQHNADQWCKNANIGTWCI